MKDIAIRATIKRVGYESCEYLIDRIEERITDPAHIEKRIQEACQIAYRLGRADQADLDRSRMLKFASEIKA